MSYIQLIYPFPEFGLQVLHDGDYLLRAEFLPKITQPLMCNNSYDGLSYQIMAQLNNYLANPNFSFDLPFQYTGSLHQLKVWQLLRQIPSGMTLSYKNAAKLIASAPRAVGAACAKNPLPVFLPCHRIIGVNNCLGGFNSGKLPVALAIKKWLLQHEGSLINK